MKKHRKEFWILAVIVIALPAYAQAGSVYRLAASWGETGSGPGQFREPMGIAVDQKGVVYVVDSRNQRIQKLHPDGRFILQFGESGKGPGQFEKPVDVAVSQDGTVYVSDYDLDRVQAFSPDGRYLFGWGQAGSGNGQFRAPAGLALDRADNVYVADFYNSRIQAFDPKGNWLKTIGKKGHGTGELNYPTDLTFDDQGNLIVADAYNHRLQKFTPEGKALERWRSARKRLLGHSSAFHVPSGVAVDLEGNIHVADSANKRVALLDRDGSYRGEWKITGDALPGVYSPTKVAVSQDGKILAVDTANDRILVLGIGAAPGSGSPSLGAGVPPEPARGDVLVRIEGMACPFCAYGIEKHLKALKGVRSARANLGAGTAALELLPGQAFSPEEIRRAVEKAGFKASEIKSISPERDGGAP